MTHSLSYLAIDKTGNYGTYSILPGFNYVLHFISKTRMHDAEIIY